MTSGISIDLTENDPDDGQPWDLTCKEKSDKLKYRVKNMMSFVVDWLPAMHGSFVIMFEQDIPHEPQGCS